MILEGWYKVRTHHPGYENTKGYISLSPSPFGGGLGRGNKIKAVT
jgi:hypothetical protein